jgi:hypothetical protein
MDQLTFCVPNKNDVSSFTKESGPCCRRKVHVQNLRKIFHRLPMIYVTSALVHLLFEVSGVNQWYIQQYTPLL